MRKKRKLVVISGPSGVGKSTLLKRFFLEHNEIVSFSVSYTSREPRKGETDGKDYYFITEDEFRRKTEKKEFVEWAYVHGNYYGTGKAEIERIFTEGKFCILDIDVQGAMQVKKSGMEALFIFIAPKSVEILRERLKRRGTESCEMINKRIQSAEKELMWKDQYDHIVINDDLEKSYKELEGYILL